MRFQALIVDDEPLGREGLHLLLAEDPDFAAIEEAKDGMEAVAAIRSRRPDLILLDVQMPEMDGFDVVRTIGAENLPPVVFVTAHDRFAAQAFEINAIDYLLKPVTETRFRRAMERVKQRLQARPSEDASRQILSLMEMIVAPPRYLKRLAVRTTGKTVFVDVEDIQWVEAAENYVQLHTAQGNPLLHVGINTIEKSLDPELFLRVHRSAIVNLRRIKELQPVSHGEYLITLQSGARLQSGRMYHARLRALADNGF